MRPFISILILIAIPQFGKAQNTFDRFYGLSFSEYGTNAVQTIDGGYMQILQVDTGGSQFPVLIKSDCRGYIEWTKGFVFDTQTSAFNLINCIGNTVAVLFNYREAATGNYMTAIAKIALDGNIVWCKQLSIQSGFTNGGLIQEASGNFVLCGNANTSPASSPAIGVIKIDVLGNILDQTKISLPEDVNVQSIAAVYGGGYVLTGSYPSSLPTFKDIYSITLTNELDLIKVKVMDTYYDDEVSTVTTDDLGNIYVCGRSYFATSKWDAMVIKFNGELDIQFSNFYDAGTTEGEIFRDMVNTRDGNLALCGDVGTFDERNPSIVKMNLVGDLVFAKEYPFSPLFTNYFYSIYETGDGGFVTTGDIRPVFGERDGPLIRTNNQGEDHCYAQPIIYTKLNPLVSIWDITGYNLPLTIGAVDVLPTFVYLPIHNIEVCSTTGPCPAFSYMAKAQCNSYCFDFMNESSVATGWNWVFDGGNPATATNENPSGICFDSPGFHTVKLTVYDGLDTSVLEKEVEVVLDCEPVIPNIFTPNGDGINDEFELVHLPENYSLEVYNRWGVSVYTAKDEPVFWKGVSQGKKVAQGVYYYVFKNTLTGKEYRGFVQVSY